MENKLQELTRKLYDEGLSKGRQEADTLLAEARRQAKDIVSQAQEEAARIKRDAETRAEDLRKNTLTEIDLAGKQAIASLKSNISELVVAKAIDKPLAEASLDPAFISDILLAVAGNWNNSSSEKIELRVMLPADKKSQLDEAIRKSADQTLSEGLDLVYTDKVKSGFHIGPKNGGYYISFTDEGFRALLGEYLRPKVSEMLYGTGE